MYRTVITACFVVAAFSVSAVTISSQGAAQGQGQAQAKPDPKPEPKPDAKPDAAPAVMGKWTMTIESPNGQMQSALDLKADPKDAKKLTGTLSSQMGETAVEGEFAEGKLTFRITFDANGTSMAIAFAATVQKDGSLSGTFDFGQGEMPWTAVRAKN